MKKQKKENKTKEWTAKIINAKKLSPLKTLSDAFELNQEESHLCRLHRKQPLSLRHLLRRLAS